MPLFPGEVIFGRYLADDWWYEATIRHVNFTNGTVRFTVKYIADGIEEELGEDRVSRTNPEDEDPEVIHQLLA